MDDIVTSANKENGRKNNVGYINLANVVSAIAVVYLHANGCFWEFSATARYWKTANVIESFFYFAVPVFFMISGATLMDFYERYDIRTFFWKRINKTVIPYVFWSIAGFLFIHLYIRGYSFSDITIKQIIGGLISGNLVSIYWFFIPLFCIYLCMPLLAAVNKEKRKGVFTFIVVAAIFINAIIPFINSVTGINAEFPWKIGVAAEYLIYIMLGYLLTHFEIPKRIRIVIYCAGVIGFLADLIGTYNASMVAGTVMRTFKGYTGILCIMYSVAMFVLLRYISSAVLKNEKVNKVFKIVSRYTFSIYLMHIYFLQTILKYWDVGHSIYYRLGAPVVVIPTVMIVTFLIRKIPMVRKLVP